jgi:large subunit ribosomal protein L9
MEVILVKDVPHLGGPGDMVKVAPGFGRNYLLPRGLAVLASVRNQRQLEHEKRVANFRKAKARAQSQELLQRLVGMTVSIACKAGVNGKLYGSVTAQDVQAALAAQGIEMDRRKLHLHEHINSLGEHKVSVRLDTGVVGEFTVTVVAE